MWRCAHECIQIQSDPKVEVGPQIEFCMKIDMKNTSDKETSGINFEHDTDEREKSHLKMDST